MVTGATGLLGSHLLCHLARSGETIIALKREKSHVEDTVALFSYYFDKPEEFICRWSGLQETVLVKKSINFMRQKK